MKNIALSLIACMALMQSSAQTNPLPRLTSIANWRFDGNIFQPIDSDCYYTSGSHICDIKLGMQNDSFYLYQYSNTTHSFSPVRRSYNTLDANARITKTLVQEVSGSSTVLNNYLLFTYDYSHPNKTIDTSKAWNATSQGWDNLYLNIDSFSSTGMNIQNVNKVWNAASQTWGNYSRTVTTYTSFNAVASVVNYSWNATTNNWDNNTRYIYSYSSNNQLLTQQYEHWNTASSTWVKTQQIATTYTIGNDSTYVDYFSWDIATQDWLPQAQLIQEFDSHGNLIASTGQNRNAAIGDFDNTTRVKQAFNTQDQLLSRREETWNSTLQVWHNEIGNNDAYYHYDQNPTSITTHHAEPPTFSMYPVPSNEVLWLQWNNTQMLPVVVNITDIQGKSVYSQSMVAHSINEPISLQAFPAGTYILQFSCNGSTSVKQFQVIH